MPVRGDYTLKYMLPITGNASLQLCSEPVIDPLVPERWV